MYTVYVSKYICMYICTYICSQLISFSQLTSFKSNSM